MPNFKSEAGNALVEFISFGLLAIAPISVFSVEQSQIWVHKAQVQSAAAQLARASALGPTHFDSLRSALAEMYPTIKVEQSSSSCCISVVVTLRGENAEARQIK